MNELEAAVIGTGWCGGIRAETLSRSALVKKLHICEIRPDRLAEVKALTKPASATLDYQDIVRNDDIRVVYICTTPEHDAFPDRARLPESRQARAPGKTDRHGTVGGRRADRARQARKSEIHHRLFATLQHQDRLCEEKNHRRHAGQARLRHGEPASEPHPRQKNRKPRAAVAGGHGVDARSRFRVLAAGAGKTRAHLFAGRLRHHAAGQRLLRHHVEHRDHGQRRAGGDRRRLEFAAELSELLRDDWIEITGTEGALFLDDTQRDNWLNTVSGGTQFPMSTMPGEQVDHVFAGQMGPETLHFLESVMLDRPPMVNPEGARRVMETYIAADLSAERGEPIDLPLNNEALSAVAAAAAAAGAQR